MRIKIGPPVIKRDFIGRKNILSKLVEDIRYKLHVILSGPRRVGKTSIALKLLDEIQESPSWNGVYISVEGAANEVDFVTEIIKKMIKNTSLWKKIKGPFQEAFSKSNFDIEALGIKVKYKSNPQVISNLLSTLDDSLKSITGNFLLIIDELPVFLAKLEKEDNGAKRVENVLGILRSMRQNDSVDEERFISWVFLGSISLESFVNNRNLVYTINDMRSVNIGAYDVKEAEEYITTICKRNNVTISLEVIEYIIHKIGWPIPFYLGIVLKETADVAPGDSLSKEHVDRGFQNAIKANKKDFDSWIQRLKLHIQNHEVYLYVLKYIAQRTKVTIEDIKAEVQGSQWQNYDELRILAMLDLLETDGYILIGGREVAFRSPIIKEYIVSKFHLR